MAAPEPWLTVAAAAQHLGLNRATVYRLIAQRRVRHHRIGAGGGRIVFRAADLDAYVKSCAVEVGEPAESCAIGELKHLKPANRDRKQSRGRA